MIGTPSDGENLHHLAQLRRSPAHADRQHDIVGPGAGQLLHHGLARLRHQIDVGARLDQLAACIGGEEIAVAEADHPDAARPRKRRDAALMLALSMFSKVDRRLNRSRSR
jgi:hypothetical protein